MDARELQNIDIDKMSEAELAELDDETLAALLLRGEQEELEVQEERKVIQEERKAIQDVIKKDAVFIQEMQAEIDKQKVVSDSLKEKIKQIDAKIDDSKSKTASLDKDLGQLHTKIEVAEGKIALKDKEIQQIDKEYHENEVKLTSLGSKIQQLDKKEEELLQERQDIVDKALAGIDQQKLIISIEQTINSTIDHGIQNKLMQLSLINKQKLRVTIRQASERAIKNIMQEIQSDLMQLKRIDEYHFEKIIKQASERMAKKILDDIIQDELIQIISEKKQDSPPSSTRSTPPSKASSGDEFVSDLSDLSLSRRDSSSSDELDRIERKNPERSPSPVPPPRKLSSSALMSAGLPPLPSTLSHPAPPLTGVGQVQSVIVDKSLQLAEEQKKQASASKALAFNSPEKDKNLVAKFGLNSKSASLSQSNPSGGVTPVIPQQRNAITIVR